MQGRLSFLLRVKTLQDDPIIALKPASFFGTTQPETTADPPRVLLWMRVAAVCPLHPVAVSIINVAQIIIISPFPALNFPVCQCNTTRKVDIRRYRRPFVFRKSVLEHTAMCAPVSHAIGNHTLFLTAISNNAGLLRHAYGTTNSFSPKSRA